MRQNYLSSTFYASYLTTVKYYAIFYGTIIPAFLNGFIVKSNSLYLVIILIFYICV